MTTEQFLSLWLDDRRPCPDGWMSFKSSHTMIDYLSRYFGRVEVMSLDHDLGPDVEDNGYKVLLWVEKLCYTHKLPPAAIPKIVIHSDNGPAAARMRLARDRILERAEAFARHEPETA